MHFRIFFLLSILILPTLVSANSPEESAKEMAYLLTENLEEAPLEVEVGNLLIEGTPVTSKFADKYLELLIERLRRNEEDFVLVKRREVTKEKFLTRGLSLSQNLASEDETVTDARLSGTYRESGNKLFINIRILGDQGQSISSAESSISISRLSLPYKPKEIKKQKEEHEQFQSNQSKIRKDFSVNVDLNKGDGSYYYHGDPFIINVELEKKSFLKVLYRQVNGETVLIYESDLRLETGNHTIPPENAQQWEIDCDQAGCGTEKVVVIASTNGFRQSGKDSWSGWSLFDLILKIQNDEVLSPTSVSSKTVTLTTGK